MSNNEDRGFNTVNNSSLSRRDQRLKLQRMTLMVIGALMLLMVVTLAVLIIGYFVTSGSTDDPEKQPSNNGSKDKIVWTSLAVSAQDTVKGDLVLVNNSHEYTFPGNEDHLKNAYDTWSAHSNKTYKLGTSVIVETTALAAVDKMLSDMAAATGYSEATLAEAYRSRKDQEGKSVAPGFSDHHTGLLCALNVKNDAAQAWLNENAAKYGFVVRYPADKEDKTGVSGYTFAYRYVGVAHASYMVEKNLCLEEYVEYLKANVTDKTPLSVTGADGHAYEIYYYSVNGSASVKIPKNFAYTLSGTNDGGVVVTIDRSADATAETSAETSAETAATTAAE
ncbi:MAG: D-alanyl-D-alanine carboxypeptidase family protein [Ruminococcaceae bacterium]|nr:D-alanyl-D-alanine carboxypeptidase family protein [Oscillospiraceae bacterium]